MEDDILMNAHDIAGLGLSRKFYHETVAPGVLSAAMRESPIGGIDQISDNTDLLESPRFRPIVRGLYESD